MVFSGSQPGARQQTEGTATSGNPTEVNRRNGNMKQKCKTGRTVNPVTSKDTHTERARKS